MNGREASLGAAGRGHSSTWTLSEPCSMNRLGISSGSSWHSNTNSVPECVEVRRMEGVCDAGKWRLRQEPLYSSFESAASTFDVTPYKRNSNASEMLVLP